MIVDMRSHYVKASELRTVFGLTSVCGVLKRVERDSPFKLYRYGERGIFAKRKDVEKWLAKQGRTLDAAA